MLNITDSTSNYIQNSLLAQALTTVNIDLLSALPVNVSNDIIVNFDTQKITNDSRNVLKGDVFCAVIGHECDGRGFLNKAIIQGASIVIRECDTRAEHGAIIVQAVDQLMTYEEIKNRMSGFVKQVVIIDVYKLNEQLFELAQAYYKKPQSAMKVVGITGTNGKTSTALILAQLLHACNNKVAVIGTVGAGIFPELTSIQNTTPGATETLQLITGFKQKNASYLTMEVSSHALDQKRVLPELFDVAVFTNLSRDHLDYHENMSAYADAKFSLFNSKKYQSIVINGDDKYAKTWLNNTLLNTDMDSSNEEQAHTRKLIVFGKNQTISQYYPQGYVLANLLQYNINGLTFNLKTHLGQCIIESPLLGDFNVDNLLAAISVLISLGFSLSDIQNAVKALTPVLGRMETFSMKNKPLAIVDYAHTPDGLENALIAAKKHSESVVLNESSESELTKTDGKLWLVFGCGGDRDKGKRSEMGAIAEKYADHIVLTNDNPRTEAPQEIFNDILKGCLQPNKINIISNRSQAIKSVFEQVNNNDCILFAGKGHEEYLIIGDEKQPYNERELVQTYYQEAV